MQWRVPWSAVVLSAALACTPRADVLTISGSVLGKEGAVLADQVARFAAAHPGRPVEIRPTPDAADQRHQLYVQWLNGWSPDPDVLQLDVVWTAEFAAAGWILPLDEAGIGAADTRDMFETALDADRWRGRLYALPWFIDTGMLYWRTDLVASAPATLDALVADARRARAEHGIPAGFVWQGARYEGLVTVFLEHLTAFGGAILDGDGRVVVDQEPGVRALTFMRDSIYRDAVVPERALSWQEEQTRFAFQNGDAVFMRNWPYAAALLSDARESAVAGRFAVAPMPSAGGRASAALGGAQLAINARSRQREEAAELVRFLTAPEQMLERAERAGQLPARRSVYANPRLARALPIAPAAALALIDHAVARPASPVYSQLSTILQIQLHRALTRQADPGPALARAAEEMRALLASAGLSEGRS